MKMNPLLFCLPLLQELVGLHAPLASLLSLRAGESDLRDLGTVKVGLETL